jgi:hypothetical protein
MEPVAQSNTRCYAVELVRWSPVQPTLRGPRHNGPNGDDLQHECKPATSLWARWPTAPTLVQAKGLVEVLRFVKE